MNRSIAVYAVTLVASLGASWMHYTSDEAPKKEGVVLIDSKKDDLRKIEYTAKDLHVVYERSEDALGAFGRAEVTETKRKPKKPVKDGEEAPPEEPPTIKVTRFKTGSAEDKLVEAFSPLMAVRSLDTADAAKVESFGLTNPEITVAVTTADGQVHELELGGETYGTRDRYAREKASGKMYVIDDEAFKPLKFAATRLPERALLGPKVEEIDSVTLGKGGSTGEWTQKNKDDRSAAYWESGRSASKDESFANWLDKALKLKSQSYVQDGDTPTDLVAAFDLTVRVGGKSQTVRISQSGDDWYAQSEWTRGLVKMTRGPTSDAAGEVQDIIDGKAPPPKEKKKPGKKGEGADGDGPPHPPGMPGLPPPRKPE